ncbi:hypothetical protein K439DRAFT_1613265 [Ramaria rubella]|nr:hypothetical protein K439DRAFT_1613265 [Ramaria rubella]
MYIYSSSLLGSFTHLNSRVEPQCFATSLTFYIRLDLKLRPMHATLKHHLSSNPPHKTLLSTSPLLPTVHTATSSDTVLTFPSMSPDVLDGHSSEPANVASGPGCMANHGSSFHDGTASEVQVTFPPRFVTYIIIVNIDALEPHHSPLSQSTIEPPPPEFGTFPNIIEPI